MNSFYEQPRSAPVPIHIEKTVSSPHVPDVSLILQSRGAQSKPAQFNDGCLSYNVWKARKEQGKCGGGYGYEHNKENGGADAQSSSRKQVRFTGPALQANTLPSPSVKQSSFEQIYIANIPNRRLDLSLVEPPRPRLKQNNPTTQSKAEGPRVQVQNEFCVQQGSKANESNTRQKFEGHGNFMSVVRNKANESSTLRKFERNDLDMSVVKQTNFRPPSVVANPNQDYDGRGSPRPEKQPVAGDSEPTVKDLLKIIQQQNEQMILLQKQVASLLENKNCQKRIEDVPAPSPPQFEPGTVFGKKLAIDVMTSFEVSIRQNFPQHRGMFLKDFNCEPKIQEITESENVLDGLRSETKQNTTIDDTLVLGESQIKIQEESPSPEHSIHVDMQDYSSDSDSDSPDIGWTIYNNVMGQVNNILKKTNSQPNELNSSGKTKNKTTQRVKQATLQHLKSLGVSLPNDLSSDSPSQSSASSEYTPSEISFAVKQLLMKYLPDDQLAKIMQQSDNNQVNNCDEAIKFAKRRPEFSFATLQYMRKYNLLNVNADAPENHPPLAEAGGRQDRDKPKMLLDVTALKQQPKLL